MTDNSVTLTTQIKLKYQNNIGHGNASKSQRNGATDGRLPRKKQGGYHLSELEGGHDHEHETAEAEVQPVSVGQAGVRLPLQQLQHRVDDYHGSPGRRIALHSFREEAKTRARRCTGPTK